MGIGVRSFLVDDGGNVRRVPWSRMIRLFRGEAVDGLSEFVGGEARVAIVHLEFAGRRPERVLRTEFNVLHLDEAGRLDPEVQSQQLRLIGESLEPLALHPETGNNVLDIRPRIARKLYRERFEWTPTADELACIIGKCL